jgi:hypothetical protein
LPDTLRKEAGLTGRGVPGRFCFYAEEVMVMSEFTANPCAICGGVLAHADGCRYDPTWRPDLDGYWDQLPGEGFSCPSCGRPYGHPDEADRCPCQVPEACMLCHRAGLPGVAEDGLCLECQARIDEESERDEWWQSQKAFDWNGPW